MNILKEVRRQLKDLGFRPDMKREIESLGIEVTVCQLIVVILSLASVVFLVVPFIYLKDIRFMLLFVGLSLFCLWAGIKFWIHRAEICEHPEEYSD